MMFLKTRLTIPFLWLVLFMLAPVTGVFAQESWELPVVVKATKADKKLEGAVVTLLKSGSTVQAITTGSNGKAEFKLTPNGDYLITVTKSGHITKRFSISTFGVPDDRAKMGFGVFEFEVAIFLQASCGDYSILNQPIAKVKYDAKNEDFGFDMSYTNSILSKLEPLEDLEQKGKQYEASVAKADKMFASKDYKGAINEYRNASGLLACEKYPGEQIKKAEELLAQGEKEKQKQKQYDDAIAAGDNAMRSKDYGSAQASYKKALEVKPGDPGATAKLAEADKQKKSSEELLAKEKEYNDAMNAGNTAKDGQKYQEALASYKKAEGIKPGDVQAKTKIAEVEGLIKAEADKQAKEKEYTDAMAAGNTALTGKKYEDALAAFQKAEGIKRGDAAAKAKIAEAEGLIKAQKDALAKEKEYTDAMTAGNNARDGKKYQEALASYKKAEGIKPGDADAKAKIAEVEGLIKGEELAKQKEKDYQDAMSAGNSAKDGKKYTDALASYKKAESIKPGDAAAKAKIAEVEGLLKGEELAKQKEKEYTDAMNAGNAAKTNKKYTDALASYRKAESIKPGDADAKAKIAEVEDLLKGEELAKQKEKEYTDAMNAGNAAKTGKKYADALASYKKAESIKPGDADAKARIAEVEGLMQGEELAKQKEKEYADAMAAGNTAKDAKQYTEALAAYNKALGIKAKDPAATAKIKEVEGLLKGEELAKQKEKDYQDAMSAGNTAKDGKKYQEALASYKKAEGIKPGDVDAKAKIAEVEGLLKGEELAKQKEKDYQDAMSAGNTAKDGKKYTDALASYKKAESIKPGDADAKAKIAEVEGLLKGEELAKQKEKEYTDAMNAGNAAKTGKKYADALASYKKAESIKPGDADAKARIAEVEGLMQGEELAKQKEKEYADAMAAGNTAKDAKQYTEALAAYNKALGIKAKDPAATAKIKEVEGLLKGEELAKQKEKDYQDAMSAGNTAKDGKKYTDALASYKKAESIKPGDADAKARITEVEGLIKAQGQAEVDAKYADLIKQADSQYGAGELAAARVLYVEASKLKSDEEHPKTRIADIDQKLLALKDEEKKKQQYNTAVAAGETALKAKKYQEARTQFTTASTLFPNEQLPREKLAAIEDLLKGEELAKQKEKEYTDAMNAGNAAKTGKKYADALASYKKAESIKPGDADAKARIAEVEGLMQGEELAKQKEKEYADAMAAGNTAKDAKQYTEALAAYNKALGIKAKDPAAIAKIKEVEGLMQGEELAKQKEKDYQDAMSAGNTAKDGKKYTDALASYKKAEGIKPGDADAKARIAEVEGLIKAQGQAEMEAKYNEVIKKADDAFAAKEYPTAKASYKEALTLKPGEAHPTKRLADIEAVEKAEKDRKLIEQQYAAAMTKAAGLLSAKKLEEAKAAYQSASDLKPEEQEPKDKIKEINDKLNAIAAAKKAEEDYKVAMAKGQKLFASRDYLKARLAYREALTAKPDDAAAKTKIDECNKELAKNPPKDLEKEYQAAKNRGDDAFKRGDYKNAVMGFKDALTYKPSDSYSAERIAYIEELQKYAEGTTIKTKKVGGCNVEERVVVKDNQIYVYTKKIWDWGGVFWFKNDVSITEAIFEAETNSTNQ